MNGQPLCRLVDLAAEKKHISKSETVDALGISLSSAGYLMRDALYRGLFLECADPRERDSGGIKGRHPAVYCLSRETVFRICFTREQSFECRDFTADGATLGKASHLCDTERTAEENLDAFLVEVQSSLARERRVQAMFVLPVTKERRSALPRQDALLSRFPAEWNTEVTDAAALLSDTARECTSVLPLLFFRPDDPACIWLGRDAVPVLRTPQDENAEGLRGLVYHTDTRTVAVDPDYRLGIAPENIVPKGSDISVTGAEEFLTNCALRRLRHKWAENAQKRNKA